MSLTIKQKKEQYSKKLIELLTSYTRVMLVNIDNVGANNVQKMRQALRGKAVFLFGKNTLIRKTIRDYVEKCNEAKNVEGARIEALLNHIWGNVGLVFTDQEYMDVNRIVISFKQKAACKVGAIAPEDVFVDPGPTGMEPTQTQFLQALNIPSKIVKGQVEITARVHLIKNGEKVGTSEATLLDKLNILPFNYNATIVTVYDGGFVIPSALLELGPSDVLSMLAKGVNRLAAISMEVGYPCLASIPHRLATTYKNCVAISIETDYEFEGSKQVKAFLKDPSAFVVSTPQTGGTTQATPTQPVVEEKEEESQSIGGLFGSDDE